MMNTNPHHDYSDEGFRTLESMSQAVWYNTWTMNKFKHVLHGSILEIGCGLGSFTTALVNFGKVTAIDIDKTCIATTKKLIRGNARVGSGDIEKGAYFFKKRRFTTIVCMNVLEHIKDDSQAVKHMYSLLKPGGNLVLLVPAHQFIYGAIDEAIGHFRRYDKSGLQSLLQSEGFSISLARTINMLGAIGWFVSGKLLKQQYVDSRRLQLFNAIAPFILPLEDIIEPPFGTSILIIAQKRQKP